VRKSAGKDFALARWADAVERAAYGGGSVDADLEADVDRIAPPAIPAAPASPVEEFAKLPPARAQESSAPEPSDKPRR
jgi:hypothetical protein